MNRHSNPKHSAARASLVLAAALCLALAPAVQAQEVAQVRPGSSGIDFLPVVEHGGFVLTVSGPEGFHHRAEFGPGESPGFSIFEQGGGALPDGVYKYELTAVPTQTQRRDAFEANRIETRSGGVEPRIQSGAFSIVGGAVVAGGETEPGQQPAGDGPVLAPKDFVINDDLIVTFSACIGNDCANGESFGFDTIRLKENNTRIRFFDTSVGSFPTVDWEIQANDSANGGQSWLRFNDLDNGTSPFTVEADTPSHTLYVDSTKRVGIGTSTPVVQLHVKDGNSPTLRLEQDTSAGFAAQTWDVAGNEANFFVRSASTGSQLPFRIRPGAPTSSIDIAANGNVGIGTAAPAAKLHVENTGNNDTDDFVVTSSGDVGIGTASPTAAIHVVETAGNADLIFDASASTNLQLDRGNQASFSRIQLLTAGTGRWSIGMINDSSDDLHFGPNTSTTHLFIDQASGDVGIGTETPQGKLDVNGAIFQRGSVLHADYVFDPSYSLESIDEHAEFMWSNRHLPAMPKATVDEQGREVVEIGAHRRGIVEELEKAHIYIDQLHKTIQALRTEVSEKDQTLGSVQDRLARLEAALEIAD